MGKLLKLTGFLLFTVSLGLALATALVRWLRPSRGAPGDNEFALVAAWDGLKFESAAPAFRRGSLSTMFGGAELDLRGATLDPAGARLEVRCLFGGAAVIVPEDWRVTLDSLSIFGGTGNETATEGLPPDAPELVVRTETVFGGVGVTARPRERDG